MSSLNKAMLIGRAGQDPEIRYLANDNVVVNFSLATSKKFKDRNGGMQEQTQWHRLVFWGNLAKIASEYVRKASLIYVEGEIEYEEYEKDGIKRYSTKIICYKLQLLGARNENESQGNSQQHQNERHQARQNQGNTQGKSYQGSQNQGSEPNVGGQNFDDFDDDIPF